MEVIKNNVHISRKSGKAANQIYIDEEINVSEVNPQIANIVKENTEVIVENVTAKKEQMAIAGHVKYNILYYTDDSDMVFGIEGMIPFEENMRIGDTDENSMLNARVNVDSTSIKLINPRRFIFKAQLTVNASSENLEDVEFAQSIENGENSSEKVDEISVLKEMVEPLSMVLNKEETFRIKDDIAIANVKPSAEKIVWKDLKLKNITTKVMDSLIQIAGEINVFVMYLPEDENMPNQWTEATVSFGGNIDVKEAREDMVSYIEVNIQEGKVLLEENTEGENREFSIDVALGLNIRLYETKEMEMISDVYSPYTNLRPVYAEDTYQKLLVKNAARTKSGVKIKLDESQGNILQICSSFAEVKIDNVAIEDNGLVASGKMKTYVIYIASNDLRPVCAAGEEVDFSHRIDAEGITRDDEYYINWRVEQVNAGMLGGMEIEIKAVVALEAIVFKNEKCRLITEINEEPLDMEMINELPGIIGYIVQNGDSLWTIAKENHTTVDKIMKINKLQSNKIKQGDRLLLVKTCKCG